MTAIQVTEVEGSALYHQYPGQTVPQPCYVYLDSRTRELYAGYSTEIGPGVSADIWHGHQQRWPIPTLKATAANELLEKIRPIAERVCDGYKAVFNGSSHIVLYDEDATEAIFEILSLCDQVAENPGNRLRVWTAREWFCAVICEEAARVELGVHAKTTDEDLGKIEKRTTKRAQDQDIELVGVLPFLEKLRAQAVEDSADE